ncbi:carbonic anhydrase [Mycolicibacterium duvalii]|uniref:Carbonic anhydrase n=1 Tax=Mycolicibacterium duvalii TaxID=39688 RepID=A0A7I7K3W2_9MYCO|nr:carbonic anhydrase [Mycolicibacterium duvalii]MCV7367645.1 carbonic anhydrase [Mycolicibacterium duvalii]PEG44055.1 carbonic anhydrase [Mycolicibacterium duvalii]BBX18765.1 carbonic anhydrase [Mycolicibacterium duvalii]
MNDPMTAWQRLRTGNQNIDPATVAAELACGSTAAAVFRCADSAVPSHALFGQGEGAVLDVSTWGHVIDTAVLATLEFAVGHLQVPLIVVLGHHDCTAMRRALHAWERADLPDGATRTAVEQVLWSIVRRHAAADSVDDIAAAHAVETGLGLVQRSPVIAARVDARQCAIVCASIGARDGRLRTHATIGPVGEQSDVLAECV